MPPPLVSRSPLAPLSPQYVDEPTFSELAQIAAVTGRYGGVGDTPKDGELVVTIVRTNEPTPSRRA